MDSISEWDTARYERLSAQCVREARFGFPIVGFLNRDPAVMGKEFNQILQELMREQNLSARQLAKDLGLPHKTVADWVGSGGSMPRDPKVLKKLADHFEVSIHRLLFGTEDQRGVISELLQHREDFFNGVFEINIKRVRLPATGSKAKS